MSCVVPRGGVRAALRVSFSAKRKSVLEKSLLEAYGGDAGVNVPHEGARTVLRLVSV